MKSDKVEMNKGLLEAWLGAVQCHHPIIRLL